MSTLQVRDVPPEVQRTLKARAAKAGQSLSEYALAILTRETEVPTLTELVERVRAQGAVDVGNAAVDIIRAERDARG